jgi:hypothetical protein
MYLSLCKVIWYTHFYKKDPYFLSGNNTKVVKIGT